MKIYLRDINQKIVDAWQTQFHNYPEVESSFGYIFDGPRADAIISPANSFSIMDGGIDATYTERFGEELSIKLREIVNDFYDGELLVGQAVIVKTNDEDFPYLISAPTMRVPGIVKNTVNAYLAFRGALIAVRNWNESPKNENRQINSILCPGLGTAIGQIPPFACARQMFEAYQIIVKGKQFNPKDCAEIWYNQQELLGWEPYEFRVDGKDYTKKIEKEVDLWDDDDDGKGEGVLV
jgi:O-acetyl-ADP-ribose deacetylase (regulator of RNase III)